MFVNSAVSENITRENLTIVTAKGAASIRRVANDVAQKGVSLRMNLNHDPVKERSALAKKQGMLLVSRAFKGEKETDSKLKGIQDDVTRLRKEIAEKEDEEAKNRQKLAALQEEYGIDPEGEEHQALKRFAAKVNSPNSAVRPEDLDALTPYQQKALFYLSDSQKNDISIPMKKEIMKADLSAIREIDLERLKDDPVGDAEKEADALEEAAAKDAVSMLTEEGLRHLEDEQKKHKEAAEKRKEEEKEEKLEEAKKLEKEAAMQELVEHLRASDASAASSADTKYARAQANRAGLDLPDDTFTPSDATIQGSQPVSTQSDVASAVTNLLNKLALTTEDIKGAAVDFAV